MKKLMMLAVLILMVSACTSPLLRTTGFRSSIYPPPSDASSPKSLFTSSRIGVPYYLPTALIPITITLGKNSSDFSLEAKEEKLPRNPEKVAIQKNVKAQANNGQSPAPKPNESAPAESAPAEPAEKPTNSVIHKMGPYEIKIDPPILVPDPRHMFYLEYNASSATADDIKIGVGTNQLLQTINAVSTDKSGEALVTLAKIASYAVMMAADATTEVCEDPSPISLSTFLDPTSIEGVEDKLRENLRPFSIDNLNNMLEASNVPLKFDLNTFDSVDTTVSDILAAKMKEQADRITDLEKKIDVMSKKPTQNEKELEAKNKEMKELDAQKQKMITEREQTGSDRLKKLDDQDKMRAILNNEKKIDMENLASDMEKIKTHPTGVLFRAAEPYQLKISLSRLLNRKNQKWCVKDQLSHTMVLAPSVSKIYSVDVDRGALITKTTNLTIVDGMLTKIDVNKPSSLIGVLNVPLEVIKAILSAPAELLTFRYQRVDKEAEIADAQAKKIASELAKIKNIQDIQNQNAKSAE